MSIYLPDLTTELADPRMAAVRRYLDLNYAVRDHYEHPNEIAREDDFGDNHVLTALTTECGFTLRLEMRMRGQTPETGYTLVETGHGMHSPILRFARRANRNHWLAACYNLDRASNEMRKLCRSFKLKEGRRLEFSDLSANLVFGLSCQLMLYGFAR